jgi:hypothetical protein
LILIPQVTLRAYFGAGIFLVIACLRALTLLFYDAQGESLEAWSKPARYITLALLWCWLLFDYQENLVKLARLHQDEMARVAIIEEAKANGLEIAIVPQHNPQLANRYSSVHRHDMLDDTWFWINYFYQHYYGANGIQVRAIPYEEWEEANY